MNRRTRVALALAAVLTVAGLTGCGTAEATSPADQVPALSTSLQEVDDAMSSGRYAVAEKLLRQLIADVRRHQEAGDLDDAAASDIVAAARRLLAELADRGAPTPDPRPTATSDDSTDDGTAPRPTKKPKNRPAPEPSSVPSDEPTAEQSDPAPAPTPTVSPSAEPPTEEPPAASEPPTAVASASP